MRSSIITAWALWGAMVGAGLMVAAYLSAIVSGVVGAAFKDAVDGQPVLPRPNSVDPMRRFLLPVLILGLAAAACSTGDGEVVRDFSEIAASDPVIELDPSGTAATLKVTTNVDAVCAVAYGTDGPSGSIATDQDMGGGAGHSDHRAVMTGLQPNTEYQYRLQGVAADGNIYRSEVFTFTTPSAATTGDFGPNVATGANVVDVSSEFSADFAAANAVDGDLATEWSSRGDGNDAFITIDLGEVTDVTAVSFRTRSMSDGSAIAETFTVEVDGTMYGPFPAGPTASEASFTGRMLTFHVASSSGGNTGAIEVEVFSG